MNFFFAPAMGIGQGSTGVVQAASCKGACGAAAAPLDVMMVLDRSRSMTDLDLANAKTAMLAVLDFYDPDVQMVGFSALPYYRTSDPTKCTVNPSQNYPRRGRDVWNIVPLSSDWKTPTGALDPTSSLVSSINCAQRTPAGVTVTPSGAGHTDLGDPMEAAVLELQQASRPEVPDTIIFFSDGEANQPRFNQPCSYANNWATNGKSNGIDIFTIAYGVAGARCNYDSVAPFANQFASRLFAAMATDSIDNLPGACAVTENTDNDHYFCETAASQLETVFRQVAVASVSRTRLIDL
jgi:hypothetical protein